jgi:hypothetical protein
MVAAEKTEMQNRKRQEGPNAALAVHVHLALAVAQSATDRAIYSDCPKSMETIPRYSRSTALSIEPTSVPERAMPFRLMSEQSARTLEKPAEGQQAGHADAEQGH